MVYTHTGCSGDRWNTRPRERDLIDKLHKTKRHLRDAHRGADTNARVAALHLQNNVALRAEVRRLADARLDTPEVRRAIFDWVAEKECDLMKGDVEDLLSRIEEARG